MLQSIRSKATSWVIRLLFVLLIVSFAIWGIGDILRGPGQQATVAKVGDLEISAAELNSEFRSQLDKLRPLFGGQIDTERAKQMGLLDRSLDQLVNKALVLQEIKRLGIAVPEETLRQRIAAIPAFRNPAGQFDPLRFQQVLRSNNMTEAGFIASMRQDLSRDQLSSSLISGMRAPSVLTDTIYRHRREQRVAEHVLVEAAAMPEPPAPDEAEQKAYLEQHKERFSTPEYRAFDMVWIDPVAVMGDFKPPEEKIKEVYEHRLNEFKRPERRSVLQISLPDEAAVKRAQEELAKGKDFLAVAKEVAEQSESTTRLGALTRENLPAELADPVFKMAEGAVSEPIKTGFGWNIVKVEKVEPEHTQTLDQARANLTADLAREAAPDVITKLGNKFDDERAGGGSVEEAAQRAGLKLVKVAAMDREGRGQDGKPVPGLPAGDELRKLAFETAVNADSHLTETSDGGMLYVKVTGATPPALKPFEQVKDQIVEAITTERRLKAAQDAAQAIVDKVKSGRVLASAAEGRAVQTSKPFTREEGQPFGRPAPSLTQALFKLKPGEPAMAQVVGGYIVAVLKEIVPADPAADAAAVTRLGDELTQQIGADIVTEFNGALRDRFGVDVRRSVIDQQFKSN